MQLRAREEERRSNDVVHRLLNEVENNTIFTSIVMSPGMSACGAMGPSMVAFLKEPTAERRTPTGPQVVAADDKVYM